MKIRILCSLIWLSLVGCSADKEENIVFVPRVIGSDGTDLDSLRSQYCRGAAVQLEGDLLTAENFRAVFQCANYDGSLEGMRALVTSNEFPSFLTNVNQVLGSESTKDLKQTLDEWLAESPEGGSKADRLLPVLARIIKNRSFQESLPVVENLLDSGKEIWAEILPSFGDVIWQERFPDTFEDLLHLMNSFSSPTETEEKKDYATEIKKWAAFVQSDADGKSVASLAMELAQDIEQVKLPNTSILEYLDQMNEKGAFVSLFLENGAIRGEEVNPKLNADPDAEEIASGKELSPEERQALAYKKLFTRGKNGEDAPIVQLVELVREFQKPHPEFVPSIARWFSANGPKVSDMVSEYVIRAQVISGLSGLKIDDFLEDEAKKQGLKRSQKVTQDQFVAFLRIALRSPEFPIWLKPILLEINQAQFGEINGTLLDGSNLAQEIASLYLEDEVAAFGSTIVEAGEELALNSAIKRFSNLHRTENLQVRFRGEVKGMDDHLIALWWSASKTSLGKNLVLDFTIELLQSLFSDAADEFAKNGLTISEWYYSSPYANPSTLEGIAGYSVKELQLLEKLRKNRAFINGEFANEMFPDESDRRAFIMLMDQMPNIWLYLKSGMSRNGNDLTRALASKDDGFLIKNYVALLVSAQESGWIRKGARLLEFYFQHFGVSVKKVKPSDAVEDRRKLSLAADAMKRVLRSFLAPEEAGKYETSTLGKMLKPLRSLIQQEKRGSTERFVLSAAREIQDTSNETINDFFNDFSKEAKLEDGRLAERRESYKAIAELLRDPRFPTVLKQLNIFFQEKAVQPALDFFAKKVDDGTLPDVLLFVRRVLGFRS